MSTKINFEEFTNKINKHLSEGGVVQIGTYSKNIIYTNENTGDFKMIGGFLHVRRGKKYDCLQNSNGLMVTIRFGRYAN